MRSFLSNQILGATALVLGALMAGPASAAPTYTVTDLGVAPGSSSSYSLGINAAGQVTGTLFNNTTSHIFLSSHGQTTQVDALPAVSYGDGRAINSGGQVTGSAEFSGAGHHAFLYANGVVKDLGVLASSPLAYLVSYGTGVNDSGQVTGDAALDNGNHHAFLYSNGVMSDLGTLGGVSSYGTGINNLGQVTGYSATASGDFHAIWYGNGQMVDLGTLGGAISSGTGINNSGQMTGSSFTSAGVEHAFLYNKGMIDLGTLPGGTYSVGKAINDSGVVTGQSTAADGTPHGFVYSNGVLSDLNTLLSTSDQQAWLITGGNSINSKGQIAAYAWRNGQEHAVLLTSSSSPLRFDFNGDGHADILFQSQSNGSVPYETMNGVTPGSFGYLFPSVALDQKVVGAADLNGDGKPDILFQSQSNGSVSYGIMNGLAPSGQYGYLFPNVGAGFLLAGTPDLNGDGHPDVLFQKQSTGDISYVLLNGFTTIGYGYLFRGLDPNLKLVGTPDLNGDGHPDLLFQNTKTGDVLYALLNGTTILTPTSYGTLFQKIPLEYQIVGTPDLNGDGFEDIVFQGQTNGDVSYVLLNNFSVTGSGYLFRGISLDFKIVGIH